MVESIWHWFLESGNQWVLIIALVSAGIGIVIGRGLQHGNRRAFDRSSAKGDPSFFKGIQYILSNEHDQAIEEFTKAVQVNSETVETYVALGNLYRSKGDIDRAIWIRQNIILRPNVDEQIKLRALFDLGKDYKKGGFLNRALNTFQKVVQRNPSDLETLREMERIYEELNDWDNAYAVRQKIARLEKGDHSHILAHHLVEMGKVQQDEEDLGKAKYFFEKAISTHRRCVDAYLHLGDLHFQKEDYRKAISAWRRVVDVSPEFTFLAYGRLEKAYTKMANLKPVEEFLRESAAANSDAFTHMALARFLVNANDAKGALEEIEAALELNSGLWEARRLRGEILLKHGDQNEIIRDYEDLIGKLNMPDLRFQCALCGFEPNRLQWRCPQCNQWDSIQLVDPGGASEDPS